MALPGETLSTGAVPECPDCGTLEIQVCKSMAGYYIGTMCDCGPYSRESGYYPTQEAAEADLQSYRPRDTTYRGETTATPRIDPRQITPVIHIGSRRIGTKGRYIGRGTALGNQFAPSSGIETPESLATYRRWLWEQMQAHDVMVTTELQAIFEESLTDQGVTLVCWCKKTVDDDTHCHGDIIASAIVYLALQTVIIMEQTRDAIQRDSEDDPRSNDHLAELLSEGHTATLSDIQSETEYVEREKCSGTTLKGRPCTRYALDGYTACSAHLPR